MLSFELSAMDLILAVAVIVLLVLYMRKPSPKPPAQKELVVEKEVFSSKPAVESVRVEKEVVEPPLEPKADFSSKHAVESVGLDKEIVAPPSEPQADSTKCNYSFGYLRKLDKGTSIPDECLGCSRVVECSSAEG